jgi:hypothetical protein
MTTPWQELTLFGGWARAQIPPPIESGVDLPSATPSVSLSTSSDTIAISYDGGPSRIVAAAFDEQWSPLNGVRERRLPREWFRNSFPQRWAHTALVHYHPALRGVIRAYAARRVPMAVRSRYSVSEQSLSYFRSLLSGWRYRLLVRFHPVLREVTRTYAARIAAVSPANRRR